MKAKSQGTSKSSTACVQAGVVEEPIASPKAHIEQLSKGAVHLICWHYYGLGFYLVVYKGLPRDSYPKP